MCNDTGAELGGENEGPSNKMYKLLVSVNCGCPYGEYDNDDQGTFTHSEFWVSDTGSPSISNIAPFKSSLIAGDVSLS